MGKRAEKRMLREKLEEENKVCLPNGKYPFPKGFLYLHCKECELQRVSVAYVGGDYTDYFSICSLGCRKKIVFRESEFIDDAQDVDVKKQEEKQNNRFNLDVNESCPRMALLLMEADLAGMFGKF